MQTELLAHLISILEGVAEYHAAIRQLSRKRKRGKARDGEEKEDVGSCSLPSGASLVSPLSAVVSQIYQTQTRELDLSPTTWW